MIDITRIQDRVMQRRFQWQDTPAAPEPVREAGARYEAAKLALDDALVDYEVESGKRAAKLREHNAAVSEALRAGKMPPPPKVPSQEDIDVRHGAIIAARETFVHEAAEVANRIAREHFADWRAACIARLEEQAQACDAALAAAVEAVESWHSARGALGVVHRTFAGRTDQLDDTSVMVAVENWERTAGIQATQLAGDLRRCAGTLRELSAAPAVVEWDATAGPVQYTARYLAEQGPSTQQDMQERAAAAARAE
jgi:hypothetical protein